MKEFLSHRGIPYVLKNLNEDPVARDEFLRAGFLLPPVTVVNGTAVAGYQPEQIEALLAAAEENGELT